MLKASSFTSRDQVVKALEDLKKRLPAHSLKPAMMQELEDLELLAQWDVEDKPVVTREG